MKKTALWTALLIGTSLSTNAFALVDSGTCGDDCYWEIDDDYKLSITGTGAMDDYGGGSEGTPWWDYIYDIESISIGEGITHLSSGAFDSADQVTQITYPDTLTSIPYVGRLSSVTSIEIPKTVTKIEDSAFSGWGLTDITLPDSLTSLGLGAFGWTRISSIVLPDSLFQEGSYIDPNWLYYWSVEKIYCSKGNTTCADIVYPHQAWYCTNQRCSYEMIDPPETFYYEKDENGFYYSIDDAEYFLSSQDMLNGDSCGELQECQATALENKGLCEWDDCYAFLDSYEDGDKIKMNGKTYASLSDLFAGNAIAPEKKRIYTVEEAEKVSKETGNTFKLRYK